MRLEVDSEQLVKAQTPTGPYRLVPGDLLELRMPDVLRGVSYDVPTATTPQLLRCRVSETGMIGLPAVGQIKVADASLDRAESEIRAAYYPKYLVNSPSVVAQVIEYRTTKVSVVGAVKEPGVYELRSDEMSLVALLTKAGGIVKEGSRVTYIRPPDDGAKTERVVLPVKGLNVPFADVVLKGGETVEVERIDPEVFTVIGLVRKPGAFRYPPGIRYSLLQALSFAGGVDLVSDPQFVKVCRQKPNGEIVTAVFKIAGDGLNKAGSVFIRPGDAVCVETTARTDVRQFLAGLFRIGLQGGASYNVAP